jgi:GNAT superfamily N-acetyltransferase
MSIHIKEFRTSDSKAVSELISSIFGEDNSEGVSDEGRIFFENNHSPEQIEKTWKETYCLVAMDDGKIIAVARGKENRWNTHLFVDKKYRGKGLAKELLNKIEAW